MTATDIEALQSNISSAAQLKKRKAKKGYYRQGQDNQRDGAEEEWRWQKAKDRREQISASKERHSGKLWKKKEKLLHNVKMENLHDKEKNKLSNKNHPEGFCSQKS